MKNLSDLLHRSDTKTYSTMNFLSVTLKVIGVLLAIYFIYSLAASIINWIGIILLVIIIGSLILFGLNQSN